KMGILDAATRLHEQSPDHAPYLAAVPLEGRAKEYLTAIAMAMTKEGAVVISENDARSIVSKVSAALSKTGQIASGHGPQSILASLTARHVLERVPGD